MARKKLKLTSDICFQRTGKSKSSIKSGVYIVNEDHASSSHVELRIDGTSVFLSKALLERDS